MALINLGMYLARSMWAFSYAGASFVTLALTWVAITGAATRNRKINIALCILSNQLSELPLTVMCMDACFYTWLNVTGTFRAEPAIPGPTLEREQGLGRASRNDITAPFITTVLPYWTQQEQLDAQQNDGWESVADMTLDIYRPNTVQGGDERPVLFYLHGGGWTSGSKQLVGPLLTEMIFHEWIVVSVNYRLNPKCGFPAQLIDSKRALRWVKEDIRAFGGNPANIVVAGDSAGGHIAALIALTANQADFQPGFESVDTSVQGCLGLSPVLDLVDLRNYSNHDARTRFIKEVAKRDGSSQSAENLKFLTEHSPTFRIQERGVPFLIIHGDTDTLVPVQHSRAFVNEFRTTCTAPIHYLEVPGGHHCFHLISSPRSWYCAIAAGQWLNHYFDGVPQRLKDNEQKRENTSAAPSTPPAPHPVGGFAICQSASSLHIQGGVSYAPSAAYLVTTNQHFRLDLSKPFDSSSPPTWANLTSDYSPFQRFHAGACSPDQESFLTVGNADAYNTGGSGSGFMMAYSVTKGTWASVSQALSAATNPNTGEEKGKDKDKDKDKQTQGAGVSAAGRTMTGFAISTVSSSSVGAKASALGLVVGGGWIAPRSSSMSAQASGLINLVTEADLLSFGGDGSIGGLIWNIAPPTGNGGNNVNTNLGPLAGARVVVLPGAGGKAVVLGGVTRGQGGGMSFANVPVVDMASGAVTIQVLVMPHDQDRGPGVVETNARLVLCFLASDGNTIFMFGGSLVSGDRATNDLYGLDVRTWTWFQPSIKTTIASPPPVRDHQCIMVGDQLLSVLGFNTNQVPASSSSASDSASAVPVAPPIYVLSTTQWTWSNQFTPLPGTPSPPPIPNVPTDGSKGKINGVGVAFGVIFGLAFLGLIGYMVFAHKRKQRRKAENLALVAIEKQRKEEADLEKKRKLQQQQQQDAPLPPTPPMAHAQHANQYGSSVNDYNGAYDSAYPPGVSTSISTPPYYQAQNPFQNPNYYHQRQDPSFASNPAYAQGGSENPFNQPGQQYYAPPPPAVTEHHHAHPPAFVPEEMGYTSPVLGPGGSAGGVNFHSNATSNGLRAPGLATGVRDKMSFIEPSSSYR
ncbi:hypothetical protein EC968_006322 [Mortierella alpina]|nr:hypothetical protein EC968_006322 [Mortierella alpina]